MSTFSSSQQQTLSQMNAAFEILGKLFFSFVTYGKIVLCKACTFWALTLYWSRFLEKILNVNFLDALCHTFYLLIDAFTVLEEAG